MDDSNPMNIWSDAVGLVLLRNKENPEALIFNRADGKRLFPGGKMEEGETCGRAGLRELLEETGCTVPDPEENLRCFIFGYADNHGSRVAMLLVADWEPEPVNMEPDKCLSMEWVPLAEIALWDDTCMAYYAKQLVGALMLEILKK